jgi:hypothetical protein
MMVLRFLSFSGLFVKDVDHVVSVETDRGDVVVVDDVGQDDEGCC